jgi:predicted pyridoxine 5'-phosphate oxidase superfamily flavin-nucleotide-binding protein
MTNWFARLRRAARQPAPSSLADSCVIMDEAMSGSPGEHALQDALGTRDRAARFSRDQVSAVLTPRMQEFIGRLEMAWIATSDGAGRCDCSFRSGPPGFMRVLDERTLAYPDYRGNGVMASSGNMLENPHVGMWFGDFDRELIGLHVNGRAEVLLPGQMHAAHPGFPEPEHPGRRPAHWVRVSVEEAYVHCRKHLPRLVSQPVARHWGTDSQLAKGGDYFGVAASRRAETVSDAAT